MAAFDDFLARVAELRRNGEAFVTATVVRVERPSSGRPGDKAVVTAGGRVHGWVGGSCAEPVVVKEAAVALQDGRSRLLRLTPDAGEEPVREGMADLPMTCFSGGVMEIFLEPHLARPRLLVFGSSPIGRALVALARVVDYRVSLIELGGRDTAGIEADRVVRSAGELAEDVGSSLRKDDDGDPRPPTYAVVATHGTFDEEALERALALGTDYVGLVTSRRRFEAIREELSARGVAEQAIDRIRAPAGIDIRAQRPEEIAVAILAEIIQLRQRQASAGANSKAGISAESAMTGRGLAVEAGRARGEAVDPVCGMTVSPTESPHIHEHAGIVYFFCCAGCRRKFAADPSAYLSGAQPTAAS